MMTKMKMKASLQRNAFRRRIAPLMGAAVLAVALVATSVASAGTTVSIVVGPAPVGSYYVTHRHVHGPGCGHYRVWNDGLWVYYYGGRWEYYTPGDRWAYYRAGYVPVPLRAHLSAAKGFRPRAVVGVSKGPGKVFVKKSAAPRVYAHPGPGPAYRPAGKGPSAPGIGHPGPSHGGPSKGKGGHK